MKAITGIWRLPDAADLSNERITLEDIDNAPLDLGGTPAFVSPDTFKALQDKFDEVTTENFRLKLEKDELVKRVNTIQTLDELMAPLGYCIFAAAVLWKNATHVGGFSVADGVMEILIGSTAVTVIGLVGMVLTGIFVGARPKS